MKTTVFKVQNIAKMALFSLLLLVVGCNSSEDPELSIFGYQSKPAWKVSQDYDMSSSMTMIVKVDLTSVYTAKQLSDARFEVKEDDIMAAYADTVCLGIDSLIGGLNHIYVGATSEGVEAFKLKYYSSMLKHIFVSESIPYEVQGTKGTINDPFVPKWTVEK